MKNAVLFMLTIIALVVAAVLTLDADVQPSENFSDLDEPNTTNAQICPDAWYVNQMPMIEPIDGESSPSNEYFIVDGERRELEEFDVTWIQENCTVQKQIVQ